MVTVSALAAGLSEHSAKGPFHTFNDLGRC